MRIPVADAVVEADLILDALIGNGLRGEPRRRTAELIRWANRCDAPVLALDGPSGLDLSSGHASEACVQATATMTLALPKRGLVGQASVGRLFVADISVPPWLFSDVGIDVPNLFEHDAVVELLPGDQARVRRQPKPRRAT